MNSQRIRPRVTKCIRQFTVLSSTHCAELAGLYTGLIPTRKKAGGLYHEQWESKAPRRGESVTGDNPEDRMCSLMMCQRAICPPPSADLQHLIFRQ